MFAARSRPAGFVENEFTRYPPPRFHCVLLDAGTPDTRLCEPRESGHFGHVEEADVFAAVLGFVHDQEKENQE
ncbi:hypothetical protein C3492_11085 [Streptomyces sp. Ru62]|nr:hypothetical protein C3492_11085 [Streptomyces sp. Ru62]